MALERVNSPEDLKKLSREELPVLAQDIRNAMLHRVSNKGGHVGPDFGTVELIIALHKVLIRQLINLYLMFRTNVIRIKLLLGENLDFWIWIDIQKFRDILIKMKVSMISLK